MNDLHFELSGFVRLVASCAENQQLKMDHRILSRSHCVALAILCFLLGTKSASLDAAENTASAARPSEPKLLEPTPTRATRPAPTAPSLHEAIGPPPGDLQAQSGEHPLEPALRWARQGLKSIQEKLHDYECTFVKRERVDGMLGPREFMRLKVRHEPFSVYLYFLRPHEVRGQEAIYVEGRNNGKLWAHSNGMRDRVMGTVALEPRGPFAMRGNRYPLTEIGLANLVRRLIEVAEADTQYGECQVRTYSGAKINGRPCLCLEVEHPRPRRNFKFHIARVYIDRQLNLPVRYESYSWPARPGEKPLLLEEYTYLNLRINPGHSDLDFDIRNPDYDFPREIVTKSGPTRARAVVGR